jgi:predicted DNA-binding transcriptional regulator AlpA
MTADEMLTQLAVLNLSEFAQLTGMDPSTVLRKEREGVIPRRRELAGRLVFLTREVREWMDSAPAEGVDPEKSAKSREIALARKAGRAA